MWGAIDVPNFKFAFAQATGVATSAPATTIEGSYSNPNTLASKCRAKRFTEIRPLIDAIIAAKGSCRIADIGGTEYYWNIFGSYVADNPVEIDLINLEKKPVKGANLQSVIGNATDLGHIDDNAYDLVHSNSVIEHVGNWDAMCRMAAHVRRLAPTYYVQTPYFWFPVEPHFRAPLFHWLPEQVRYRMLMTFKLGDGGKRHTVDAAMRGLQSSALLDKRQMLELFPDAEHKPERFFGLTKSLMAIRKGV